MGEGNGQLPNLCDVLPLRQPAPRPSHVHTARSRARTYAPHIQITDSSDEEEGSDDPGVKQKTLIEVCAGNGVKGGGAGFRLFGAESLRPAASVCRHVLHASILVAPRAF